MIRNQNNSTALVLLNLGGPVSQEQVEPFLKTLFGDRDLIKLPGPAWFQPLYAWGIAKIRTSSAKKRYAEIGGGSPLLAQSAAQANELRVRLRRRGYNHPVKLVFRTSQPRAEGMFQVFSKSSIKSIIPVSLYPHSCKATTGSSVRELELYAKKYGIKVEDGVLDYAENPIYIQSLVDPIKDLLEDYPYATVIFSAHSLPVKQIQMTEDPYESEIHKTVQKVSDAIGTIPGGYLLGYQSRVGPIRWLEPSLKSVLKECAGRDVIVVPISFVSEHIETLHELDIEYKEIALNLGIKNYLRTPTPCINPSFMDALESLSIAAIERLNKKI